jgi:hypothetical protein
VPDFAAAAVVTDSCSGAAARSQTPAAGTLLGLGVHTVAVKATDPAGNVATCTTTFTVVDTTAPKITSVSVTPNVIKNADGDMVRVVVTVKATDNCDTTPTSKIISITSDEPVTGRGDSTSPDWRITGDLKAKVRAERSRYGDGRIYTITIECRDDSGNVSTATTTVSVPRRR